ncbi:hypothetical protein SVA_0837 [Sulfurifustis variabilis]|uniref:EF-hand domain-containing protein n=1 Tax=Sulfurifustis variabilis TaxID=1675686 RepID=A0A1B4V1Q5_9GAMM|nr:EF-hand domain-containing protein [Sulfurifustis variabilis]BAU47416.1 hypothetical protein SVA_0837 [Sulfurifustis variabilis]
MRRIVPTFVALAFSAASALAVAAEQETLTGDSGPPAAMPSFEQADKDKSGSVEASETTGIAGLDLTAADKDNDGKLSRSEYESAKQSHERGTGGSTAPEPGGTSR